MPIKAPVFSKSPSVSVKPTIMRAAIFKPSTQPIMDWLVKAVKIGLRGPCAEAR